MPHLDWDPVAFPVSHSLLAMIAGYLQTCCCLFSSCLAYFKTQIIVSPNALPVSTDMDLAVCTASSFVFMNVEDPHSFISLVHFHLTFGCAKSLKMLSYRDAKRR